MSVRVVTDSSAGLSADQRRRWGIRQVPLHILLDGTDLLDGIDTIPVDICDRDGVTTAGASAEDLTEIYSAALADSDGDGVVAVHLSAELSSTFMAAQHAGATLGGQVRVVDSRAVGMASGFVAIAAARAAAGGADLDAVAAAARAATTRVHAFAIVRRLHNLRRSGRITAASAWLGTALALTPVLHIEDGKLALSQRVRTLSKSISVLLDRVCATIGEPGEDSTTIAVQHVRDPEAAEAVAAAIAQRLPMCRPPTVTELGPVLGVHIGSGAVVVSTETPPRG